MPKHDNYKLKILYVKDILEHRVGEKQMITMATLLAELAMHGVEAERKSIADDIRLLQTYGMPVREGRHGREKGYYVEARKP